MKYKNLLMSLGAASLAIHSASAQVTPPAVTETRVTISLQLEYQAAGLKPRNSSGETILGPRVVTNNWVVDKSKPEKFIVELINYQEQDQDGIKTRYGNKELLTDLVSQAVIPSITNYYISMIHDSTGRPYALYATNSVTLARVRLDNTYITFDTPTAANTTDRFNYKQMIRNYTSPEKIENTFKAEGGRKLTAQFPFAFTTTRFTTPVASGRIRLDIEAKPLSNTIQFWVPSKVKSTAVVLAGNRTIVNELGATVSVPVLVDGTIDAGNPVTFPTLAAAGVAGS